MITFNKVGYKYFNNIPYYFSLFFIIICFSVSIFSFFIIPDKTINANTMNLSIQSMKPGFNVDVLTVPNFEHKSLKSYFFGLNKPIEQYPINDYWFSNDSINFTLYNKYGENPEIKSIHLNKFVKPDISNVQNKAHINLLHITNNYVTNKTFFFWNRHLW